MIIDLTNFISGSQEEVLIDDKFSIEDSYFENTAIKGLEDTVFQGSISKLVDGGFLISGNILGTMKLQDDVTLELVSYPFCSEVSEEFYENKEDLSLNLRILNNKLDITDFLWQNILVEVPTKVHGDKGEDISLKGDGWRLITEEELALENSSPLSELGEIFNQGKE